MKWVLNTGRTVTQGRFVEHKNTTGYSEEVSTCFMNPLDVMELGLIENENVVVRSEWGSVVLMAVADEGVPSGMIFVPMGPFANHIVPGGTHSAGMPDYKNILVEVDPTDEPRKTAWDLIEDAGGVRYEGA
jgi:formylmethanofuran dehydrogenase subunit D